MLLPLTFYKNCASATQILKNELKVINTCQKLFDINEKSIIQMDELIPVLTLGILPWLVEAGSNPSENLLR